jgi:nucleoid-associated protein YgaU
MGRYGESDVMITSLLPSNKQKVKNYQTTIYRQIPKRDNDIYLITQHGDRLDNLAVQFYNDATLWWYIAKANNLFSINVEPNTSLRIPSDLAYAEPL